MTELSLLRTVRFKASHRYGVKEWTEEENRAVFGDNVDPHSHDWSMEVTVTGPVHDDTGFVVDLTALDLALREEVLDRLEGADINQAVPEVRDGTLQPSTENLARWFFERLSPRIPGPARLARVRLFEGPDLGAEYTG